MAGASLRDQYLWAFGRRGRDILIGVRSRQAWKVRLLVGPHSMVGARSLWRFNADTQTLSPKALARLVPQAVDVFRDGPALWIRTRDNHGWPVVVRGNYVHP